MPDEEEFTKIVVDLPEGDLGVFGEGIWTVALGNDLYEVRNSPWHSREINFNDVVKAIAPTPEKHPVFVSVERRGGHRTIQFIILDKGIDQKDAILKRVNELGGSYENANGKMFALDFQPSVDWGPTLQYLEAMEKQELLEYRWSAY